MLEHKTFKVPHYVELSSVSEHLDEAFAEGWLYTAHFPVPGGILVVLQRIKPTQVTSVEPERKEKPVHA